MTAVPKDLVIESESTARIVLIEGGVPVDQPLLPLGIRWNGGEYGQRFWTVAGSNPGETFDTLQIAKTLGVLPESLGLWSFAWKMWNS